MLQKLREKTSGKIASAILVLMAIPFAFFGVESYMSQRVETYVARISQAPSWWPSAPDVWPLSLLHTHHDIDADEFRRRLEVARARARDEQGDKFDAKAFESVDNKRKLLDDMIDEQVMRLAAEGAGILVSDAEVRAEIQKIPDFQVDGRFNADRYQMLLGSQSPPLTPLQFEARVRDNLQFGLIPSRLTQSSFVTGSELDRIVRLLGERRDVSFVEMPPAPVDTAPVSSAEIQAWYKSHARDYRRPETVRLEYIELDGATLPPPVVDEAALRKRYDEQVAKFSSAEQREVAHVLVQVAADASDAAKKAAEARANKLAAEARATGADFAAIARANSDDTGSKAKGGDLGWLAKASLPGPVGDAAFAMQQGEVRGPVKSDFGWHIIKVNQIRAGSQQPFESVRAQLEAELAETGKDRAFNDLSGKLVDAVYKNPTSLAPAAAALGLTVQATAPFSRAGGQGIAADPKVVRAAFSDSLVQDGTASDPIELGPNRMVMIRVLEHEPEAALPLSAVSNAVVAAIRADRQHTAAEAAADALLKTAKAKGLAAAANDAKLAAAQFDGLERSAAFPPRVLVDAFFDAPRPANNLAEFGKAAVGGRYVVFEVRGVHDGDASQVTPEQREQLREQMSMSVGLEAQKAYVGGERARYRIEVAEDRL